MSWHYVTMKRWRIETALRFGVKPETVSNWLWSGKLSLPPTIRKNRRVVFVRVGDGHDPSYPVRRNAAPAPPHGTPPTPPHGTRWVQMKEWRETMAERLGISASAVSMRLSRGLINPKMIRRSKRDVLVLLDK
jgi:hypothetical protein